VNTFTHVSASQLDAFADASAAPFVGGEGCNRAWWFEKILGIPKPPKVSADRGVLIHKRSEQYLKTGDPTHLADGLMLAKDLLPDPALLQQGRLKVEHPVSAKVIDGVVLKGFVDIWLPWQIDDLKTSNDPRWFKTPEEIRSNLQMNIYGYINGITHGTGKHGTVRLAHIQLHVPRNTVTVVSAKRVEVEVPIDATRKVWTDRVVPLTRRMQEVAPIDDPSRVTPNWSACSRYGGCPYQDRCAALKLAGAGGTARSPFAGMNATLNHPVPQEETPALPVLEKIISGGQTGGDQGGLFAGRDLGIPTGGTAPAGWRTQAGSASWLASFGLVEHASNLYPPRTEDNVRNADGTIVFGDPNSPGCTLTRNLCIRHGKQFLIVLWKTGDPVPKPDTFRAWLRNNAIRTLNVAGNREESQPGIRKAVRDFLVNALSPNPASVKENTAMPPSPTAPRLPPALAAKVGQVIGASTPVAPASATPALTRAPNTTPAAASVATQARTTAAPSPATPRLPPGVRLPSNVPVTKVADVPVSSAQAPAARATGVVPPDAPNPRAAAPVQTPPQTQAPAPSTPAPDVEPAPVTDQQKEQALLALGWPSEVLEIMLAEVFAEAYEAKIPFADVELVYGEDTDGQYVESFARKAPPAPVAPARRRREAAGEAVATATNVAQQVAETQAPAPKSKGVPFGAPLAAQTARRPRDAAKRLATYGYADSVIAKMSTDTMKYLLDNEVPPTVVSILPDGSGVRFDSEPEASSEEAEVDGDAEYLANRPREEVPGTEEYAALHANDAPVETEAPVAETSEPDPVFTADPTAGLPTSTKASREEAKTVLVREPYTTTPVRKLVSEADEVAALKRRIYDLEKDLRNAETAVTEEAEALANNRGLTLYIDCVPTKGEAYTDFAEFIAPHVDAVAQAHGAENFYDLDKLFGRGPGMVAARLLLPANRPTGALVIDSRHPFAAACVADLQRFATRVVRAMR
jgi:hypothetical protein